MPHPPQAAFAREQAKHAATICMMATKKTKPAVIPKKVFVAEDSASAHGVWNAYCGLQSLVIVSIGSKQQLFGIWNMKKIAMNDNLYKKYMLNESYPDHRCSWTTCPVDWTLSGSTTFQSPLQVIDECICSSVRCIGVVFLDCFIHSFSREVCDLKDQNSRAGKHLR